MRLTRIAAALAVAAFVAAPALAAASNPAASLALTNVKAGRAQAGDNAQADDGAQTAPSKNHTGTLVIAGLGAAAVIGGAVALGSGHHHRGSMPASN